MPTTKKPKLIAVVGPTASGKSELAVFLAKKFNGEIISADSRQVYKGMDIGTGKVTKNEMQGIPHYLLDVAHPSRQFTVAQYKKHAEKAIRKIHKNGRIPILVGGTGFYIQAIIDDINLPEVPPNKELREKLSKLSTEELLIQLKNKDPRRAASIDKHNKRRLIRALEIVRTTKKWVPAITKNTPYDLLVVGINMSREELYTKIHKRLKKRLRQGMIKEVKKLRKDYRVSWQRLQDLGLEYKWVSLYLQGEISRSEMEQKLERDIKRYAKRQISWFKGDKRIHWIKNKREAEELVESFLR